MLDKIPSKKKEGGRQVEVYLKSLEDLYGRLAENGLTTPQAIEVEQSVLGSMMIDKEAADTVFEVLGERSYENSPFYRDAHTAIYRAMLALESRSEKIDLISVANQLRLDGTHEQAGGSSYLVELTTRVVTTANVESHSRIILEKLLAREMIRVGEEMKLRAFSGEDDAFELLDSVSGALLAMADVNQRKTVTTSKTLSFETVQLLETIESKGAGLVGIASGIADLDALTTGWCNANLIILAARPSQGKTALALKFGIHAAPTTPTVFFSLEMSNKELGLRILCTLAKISLHRARQGQLFDDEWQRVPQACKAMAAMNFYVDDTPELTFMELKTKCRRLKQQSNIGLVIIDYLQLMVAPKSSNREQEIAKISRSLKSLSKELDLPIIALSQLNRGVESRSDKRPMLSDLRESGAIEQDADLVIFLYRPETYGIDEVEHNGGMISSDGIAEVILAKQRNGPIGDLRATFQPVYASFENYIHIPQFEPGVTGDSGYGQAGF